MLVSQKRKIIASIIEKLAQDNLKDSSQLLPSINFTAPAPVTRSRRRKPCYKESLTEEEDDFVSNDADTDFSFAAAGFYGCWILQLPDFAAAEFCCCRTFLKGIPVAICVEINFGEPYAIAATSSPRPIT